MTLLVGLTGGIGAGKSTVCKLFARLGVPIIDADEIARTIVAPGQPLLRTITREFGKDIVDARGKLRRDELRSIVFRDPQQRKRLEDLLHPLISQEMQHQAEAIDAPYCILCIPLLIETGLSSSVQRILVVDTPEALQVQRVIERDHLTVGEVEAIMRIQASREARLKVADDVIVNDSDIAGLEEQVTLLHQKYLQLKS